jgi:hypothetical protein
VFDESPSIVFVPPWPRRTIRTARTHGIAEIAISGVNEREEGHDKS